MIAYEKNPIVLEDNSQELLQEYNAWLAKQNATRTSVMNDNNAIVRQKNELQNMINQDKRSITNYEDTLQRLRNKRDSIKLSQCPTCKQAVPFDQSAIDKIVEEAESIKAAIAKHNTSILSHQTELDTLVTKDVPNEVLYTSDPFARAKILGKELKVNTNEERDAVSQYENNKRELGLKEDQLKKLGEINDKVLLSSIDSAKKLFTKNLQDDIKEFNLEIELFKEQANGKLVESFIISLNGKPYGELSNGNKLLLQIRMALAFIKKL